MRRICVLLPFVLLLMGFAPAPFPRPERRAGPGLAMVGEWVGRDSKQRLRVAADRLTYNPDMPNAIAYVWKVNASVRPTTYHVVGLPGGSAAGREFRGIWRVQGDTFTMTYNFGNQPLPTAFEGPGKGAMVEVYVRVR